MYVIDDYNVPGPTGHSVRLLWKGPTEGLVPTLGLFLLVGILLLMAGAPRLSPPSRGSDFFCIGCGVACLLVFYILFRSDIVRLRPMELTWEARDREWRIRYGSGIPLVATQFTVPFDRISQIELEVGAEGIGSIPIRLRAAAEGAPPIDVPMTIRNVDARPKALDLALRIGAAMGFKGYRLSKCTPHTIRIELLQFPEQGCSDETIPTLDDDPTYECAGGDPLPVPSGYQIPRFSPATFAGPWRVVVWDPPREFHLERPAASVISWVGGAMVWALGGFVLALTIGSLAATDSSGGDPAGGIFVFLITAAALGAGLLLHETFRGRRAVHMDGDARVVRTEGFLNDATISFTDLRCVTLRGHTTAVGPAGVPRPWARYWCELVLVARDRSITIPGPSYQGDAETPHDVMLPMAVDLAEALGVPWFWQEYAIPPGTA